MQLIVIFLITFFVRYINKDFIIYNIHKNLLYIIGALESIQNRNDTIFFSCYFSSGMTNTRHLKFFFCLLHLFELHLTQFLTEFKIESLKGKLSKHDKKKCLLQEKKNEFTFVSQTKTIFVYSIKTACSAVCNSCCKNNRKHCTSNMSTTIHVCRNWSTIV